MSAHWSQNPNIIKSRYRKQSSLTLTRIVICRSETSKILQNIMHCLPQSFANGDTLMPLHLIKRERATKGILCNRVKQILNSSDKTGIPAIHMISTAKDPRSAQGQLYSGSPPRSTCKLLYGYSRGVCTTAAPKE